MSMVTKLFLLITYFLRKDCNIFLPFFRLQKFLLFRIFQVLNSNHLLQHFWLLSRQNLQYHILWWHPITLFCFSTKTSFFLRRWQVHFLQKLSRSLSRICFVCCRKRNSLPLIWRKAYSLISEFCCFHQTPGLCYA